MIRLRNQDEFIIYPSLHIGTSTTEAAEVTQAPVTDGKIHMKHRVQYDCYLTRIVIRATNTSAVGDSTDIAETLTAKVGSTAVSKVFKTLDYASSTTRTSGTLYTIDGLGDSSKPVLIAEGSLIDLVFNTSGTKGTGTSLQFSIQNIVLRRVPNVGNVIHKTLPGI